MSNEKRLIDANALMDAFRSYMVERYDREKCVSAENCKTCEPGCLWYKTVNNVPTVDAVEVVRCKDCKHFVAPQGVACCDNFFGLGFPNPSGDDFCSYGERKDNA